MTSKIKDEHDEVIQSFIFAMISCRSSLGDFISQFELYDLLTDNEKELLNETGVILKNYIEKEQLKNGNVGQ